MLVDSLTQSQSHTDKTQPPPEPETVSRNPTQSLPVARGWREADSFPASVSFPGVCMWGPSTAIATAAAVFHAGGPGLLPTASASHAGALFSGPTAHRVPRVLQTAHLCTDPQEEKGMVQDTHTVQKMPQHPMGHCQGMHPRGTA